jgi:hypothetical protein
MNNDDAQQVIPADALKRADEFVRYKGKKWA